MKIIEDYEDTGNHDVINFEKDEDIFYDFKNKIKIGNVRNPWDWYVSLWAYGCQKKGGLYKKMTSQEKMTLKNSPKAIRKFLKYGILPKKSSHWERLYSDYNDKDNFKEWLKIILKKQNNSIGEMFIENEISKTIGLFTYRYLGLYCYNGLSEINNEKDYSIIKKYDLQNNFIDVIFKTESLDQDIINNYALLGVDLEQLKSSLPKGTKNRSKRESYKKYYDDELMNLVQEKDKLIIEKYNYIF